MEKTLPPGQFFGTRSSFADVHGFQVAELVYAPSVILPTHAHAQANFCFVLQGRYEETCGRNNHDHSAAHLVFHPAGQWHSDRHAPGPVRLLSVELAPDRLEQVCRYAKVFDTPGTVASAPLGHLCRRLHHEIRQPDDVSTLAVEGLILEILATSSRERRGAGKPARTGWVCRAEELLRCRYAGTINLELLAREVGVHPVHLARTFRSIYRCGPAEYIRRLRVEAACRYLRASSQPLGEVAHLTGFSDQSHLTRTFRRLIGVTPGEFRRQFGR